MCVFLLQLHTFYTRNIHYINKGSNMTSFFRFVDKRKIYLLGIISLAHAPVHVTDFPVVMYMFQWIIVCSNLAAWIVCDIVRKRKYKLPSSNQSIPPYLYS